MHSSRSTGRKSNWGERCSCRIGVPCSSPKASRRSAMPVVGRSCGGANEDDEPGHVIMLDNYNMITKCSPRCSATRATGPNYGEVQETASLRPSFPLMFAWCHHLHPVDYPTSPGESFWTMTVHQSVGRGVNRAFNQGHLPCGAVRIRALR